MARRVQVAQRQADAAAGRRARSRAQSPAQARQLDESGAAGHACQKARQHQHDTDLYGHVYPGEMDRYAARLDHAAEMADAAKMRPDEEDDDPDSEEPTWRADVVSALGGTRTPTF